jgi:hypothetical protein
MGDDAAAAAACRRFGAGGYQQALSIIQHVSTKHQPPFLGAATANIGYQIFRAMTEQIIIRSNQLQLTPQRRERGPPRLQDPMMTALLMI